VTYGTVRHGQEHGSLRALREEALMHDVIPAADRTLRNPLGVSPPPDPLAA
jgi:hypothetical protein